jgi:hypothetical protein
MTDPADPTERTSPAGPTTPAPGDDRVAVLAVYFRQNHGRFTDEALAAAARQAGYSDAEIASARALAAPSGAGTGDGAATVRRTDRRVVAAVAIAYVVALYALYSIIASLMSDISPFMVAIGGLLAGVVAWALLREERPSLAQGIGCGVVLAIAIPLIVILVILGICLVAGSGQVVS